MTTTPYKPRYNKKYHVKCATEGCPNIIHGKTTTTGICWLCNRKRLFLLDLPMVVGGRNVKIY